MAGKPKARSAGSDKPPTAEEVRGRARKEAEQIYSDACIAAAAAKLDKELQLADDPQERMLKFFEWVKDGMPAEEAADYALNLKPEKFRELMNSNSVLRFLVTRFIGSTAASQYRKLTTDGSYASAKVWLEANRPKRYRNQTIRLEVADTKREEAMAVALAKFLNPDQFRNFMDSYEAVLSASDPEGSEVEGPESL